MPTKKRPVRRPGRPAPAARRVVKRRRPAAPDPILAPIKGAERRSIGHVKLEVVRAGVAR